VRYDEATGVPNTDPALQPPPAHFDQSAYGGSDPQRDESIAVLESIEEIRETEAERAEREAFLSALPEDVRREVLAQETAQKRRLSAFAHPPPPPPPATTTTPAPLTPEQMEFLRTLPADLRDEVERDLRAQNEIPSLRSRTTTTTPARAPAVLGRSSSQPLPPPPPPPSQSQDADLLGLSPVSPMITTTTTPLQSAANSSPQPPVDMFQNLSVRGVNKDSKSSKSQQI